MRYEDFKEKATAKHGNKYEYPVFNSHNHKDKVEIICKEHGPFMQTIYAHLKGEGCPLCRGRKFTTETYIAACKEKFGEKFDYSRVQYKGKREKVCIGSDGLKTPDNPEGLFWQYPLRHLDSSDGMLPMNRTNKPMTCKKPRITQEDFIKRLKGVFGDKYDFSKTQYAGANQKCVVTCPEHGDFESYACNLSNGHGCPACGKTKKLTVESFIEKATKVHEGKYNYDKVRFKNSNDNITIICPVHGEFQQNVTHHLRGHGCPSCARNKQLTTGEFVERAKSIHGDTYNYDNTGYVNIDTNVDIVCPKHGHFFQTPGSHLSGQGCPYCKQSYLEREVNDFLTENNIPYIREKTFDTIKNIRCLPFDFYLPEQNILIECQGLQHFSKVDFFDQDINERISVDLLKKKGANELGIKVLYYTKQPDIKTTITENEQLHEIYEKDNLFTTTEDLLNAIITK